jgi:phage/plasmid-like protein (TIGR03299 family)
MGHNINFNKITGLHSVMTMGDAWHGLGQVVTGPQTADETLKLSGLDFEVVKQPIFLADGTRIPERFATVRTDNNSPLGVVGKKYEVFQNTDAFGFFDQIVNREEAIYTSAGALGSGERIWLQCKLPEHVLVNGEAYDQYLLFSNSHDGTRAIDVRFTPVRVVCENTMRAALTKQASGVYRVRHTASAKDQLSTGASILGLANVYFKEIAEVFEKMAEVKMPEEKVQDHFLRLILGDKYGSGVKVSDKAQDALFEMNRALKTCPDNEQFIGTALGAYNGLTYYADHWKDYRIGTQFQNSQFGLGERMRENSFALLNAEYAFVNAN